MARMDESEVEIINIGPHDDFGPGSPRRDRSEERFARRSSGHVDDELSRGFQRLSLKDKDRNRRKSLSFEPGRITRRWSYSGGKRNPRYLELYRFEKSGEDWTVADRIRIKAPQDELEKKVAKGKSRNPVVETMTKMHHIRRAQINRLLDKKNNDERDGNAEWVPVLVEKTRWSGKSILTMNVIIAKTFKPGGSAPREKRSLFVGEKSDLRVPLRSKSRDSYRDKDRFNEIGRNGRSRNRNRDQYGDPDFFAEAQLFTPNGRPIDDPGRPFDGRKADRRPIPLENPIGGPIQALQPLKQAPGGWADPPPPRPLPQDGHHNQQPMEIINSGHPGGGLLDLDKLLEPNGGGGGHAHQNFDVDVPPVDGAGRRRSSGGSKQSRSRPRPEKIYVDQGSQRRGYRRGYHYGDSSNDDPDEHRSVFFDGDSGSSITSYGADHEHLTERRWSLNRPPSNRRGEYVYREHCRRPSYNPGRSKIILETARTPRRPGTQRRQTIAYPVSRQIAYHYTDGRRRSVTDEPLSPVVMQQSDSPGFSRRRESMGPPPEVYYPHEVREIDRAPDDYPESMGHDNRFREDDVRRQEREMDERDAIKGREGSRGSYRDTREKWDQR